MKLKPFIRFFIGAALVSVGAYLLVINGGRLLKDYQVEEPPKVEAKNESLPQVETERDPQGEIKTESKKNNLVYVPNVKLTPKQGDALYPVRPEKGENIGQLIIPKLSATLPIYHGTDDDELEKGVGHFAGSVLPGEQDNSVLSGHRDTVFRKLGDVGVGDLLIVNTSAGEFTYKVKKVRIVDEDDRTVIVPKRSATLTLTTCYPFNYIGSAPERYVLVADLINSKN